MKYLYAFSLAWALCTRIPLSRACYPSHVSGHLQSLSVLFYPMVGLLVGAILLLLYLLLPEAVGALFSAAVLVAVWVMLTGAMHLDGLADSIDAYFASHKGGAETLAIFKDPSCGPMAVVAIVLVLLLKVAALTVLIEQQQLLLPLMCALVISRGLVFPFMAFTPYLRHQGLAHGMVLTRYRRGWFLVSTLALLITVIIFPVVIIWVLPAMGLAFYWRHIWLKAIGGFVGDCLGALIEMIEVLILIMAVLLCY